MSSPLRSCPHLLPGSDSEAARTFLTELTCTPRLAHHPICRCYDNHLLRLGRWNLCLGCTSVAAGIMTASSLALWLALTHGTTLTVLGVWRLQLIGIALFLPTLGQLGIQWKPYKIASRFLLGVASVTLWLSAMALLPVNALGLLLRLVFIAIFVAVYFGVQSLRSLRTAKCMSCPDGAYPFCQDNLHRNARLIEQLRRSATPQDLPFVEFITTLSRGGDAHNEAVSLRTPDHPGS